MPESAFVFQRVTDQTAKVFLFQRVQDEHFAAGQQRAVYLKRGVFRRGADENNAALFHERQKSILLGFIEAVNLIHEQDGFPAEQAAFIRLFHDLPDLLDSARYRGKIDKIGARTVCDDARQRRLPYAGRPPEDHRADLISLDQSAQYFPPRRAGAPARKTYPATVAAAAQPEVDCLPVQTKSVPAS